MPILDGYEMIKTIRQLEAIQDICIITSSASVLPIDQHNAVKAGSNIFLAKPINAEALLDSIAELLSIEWKSQEEDNKLFIQPPSSLA